MKILFKPCLLFLLSIIAAGVLLPPSFIENIWFRTYDGLKQYQDERSVQLTQITGGDETNIAQVVLDGGLKKLAVLATAVIEQVFGKDPQGTTFFFFGATLEDAGGIGAAGDTVRVQIPAAVAPLNTIYPAVDYTYTILAADVSDPNPERAVALKVCLGLKANANFIAAKWSCDVARDFAYVHIVSKLFNEFGTRTAYTVTCSGTTICTYGESGILRRGKETELSRSPNDPARLGVLSISGSVSVTPGEIADQKEEHFTDSGGLRALKVNGSVTPQLFYIRCEVGKDFFIQQIRFYGTSGSIKVTSFFNIAALTNGMLVNIVSDGQSAIFTESPIKTTAEFMFHLSNPIYNYRLDYNPAADLLIGARTYENPFPIRACKGASFNPAVDDYIKVTIQDNLSSIGEFEGLVFGFLREQ